MNRFNKFTTEECKELEVILTHWILNYFEPNKMCIACEIVKELEEELKLRGIIKT